MSLVYSLNELPVSCNMSVLCVLNQLPISSSVSVVCSLNELNVSFVCGLHITGLVCVRVCDVSILQLRINEFRPYFINDLFLVTHIYAVNTLCINVSEDSGHY